MKRIFTITLLAMSAFGLLAAESQAGWKIRGWYTPKKAVQCKMKTVVAPTEGGNKVVRKIRVCY